MGVNLCENINDVHSQGQAAVHLTGAGIYMVFEVYFIWQTVKLIKRTPQFFKLPTLVFFYVFIHLTAISCFLYYIGDILVCFNKIIYAIVGDYCDVLHSNLIFLMLYRIDLYLCFAGDLEKGRTKLQTALILICIIDTIIYFPIVILYATEAYPAKVILFYRGFLYNIITFIVLYIVAKTIKLMKQVPNAFNKKPWHALIGVLLSNSIIHLIKIIYQLYVEYNFFFSETVEHSVAMLILDLLSALIPCLLVVCFVVQVSKGSGRNESFDDDMD